MYHDIMAQRQRIFQQEDDDSSRRKKEPKSPIERDFVLAQNVTFPTGGKNCSRRAVVQYRRHEYYFRVSSRLGFPENKKGVSWTDDTIYISNSNGNP